VPRRFFEPEHMARGIVLLYPDMAHEIAFSLMRDAMMIGESARAMLWWDVLVRIGRIEEKAQVRVH
jgi:hypothetical protein